MSKKILTSNLVQGMMERSAQRWSDLMIYDAVRGQRQQEEIDIVLSQPFTVSNEDLVADTISINDLREARRIISEVSLQRPEPTIYIINTPRRCGRSEADNLYQWRHIPARARQADFVSVDEYTKKEEQMTRKDFECVARAMKASRGVAHGEDAWSQWNATFHALVDELEKTNANFNYDMFAKACGKDTVWTNL